MSQAMKIKTRYRRLRYVVVLAIMLLLLAVVYEQLFLSAHVRSDDAYVSGNIIPVQALVPGVVVRVDVDNSMQVHVGQPLLEQEHNLAYEHRERAAAALAEAVRQIRSQIAQVSQFAAQITALQAQHDKLEADLARYVEAQAGGAVSSQKVSDTRADLLVLEHQIREAQAHYEKAQALVARTDTHNNPLILQKRADFIESDIEYRRANVVAPVQGYVANRRAEAGQTVSAGQLLLNLIPLQDLWVTANIKETDMGHVRPGLSVQVVRHVYGEETIYHGKVLGIEPAGGSTFSLFPPDNATGNYIHIVERIPVRIGLQAAELAARPLRPGMSVSVDIDTHNYSDLPVLRSQVEARSASYSTSIYDQEMAMADASADRIIDQN